MTDDHSQQFRDKVVEFGFHFCKPFVAEEKKSEEEAQAEENSHQRRSYDKLHAPLLQNRPLHY